MYAWQQNSREHQARETAVIDLQAAGESHHVHREGEQKNPSPEIWGTGYGEWQRNPKIAKEHIDMNMSIDIVDFTNFLTFPPSV